MATKPVRNTEDRRLKAGGSGQQSGAGRRKAGGIVEDAEKPAARHQRPARKSPLSRRQLEEIRQRLAALREQLVQGVREEYREVVGRDNSLAGDSTDIAQDLSEESVSFGILANEEKELDQVEAALECISDGTYGLCEVCGEPIPLKRLRLIPYATKCVRCKSLEEREGRGQSDTRFSFGAVEDASEEEAKEEEEGNG